MFHRLPFASALVAAPLLLGACSQAQPYILPPNLKTPYAGYESPRYKDPALWLCKPDKPGSPCDRDRSATEILPGGGRMPVPSAVAAEPKVDCFYVYPTVDLSLWAYNHEDFTDTSPMAEVAFAQAANFQEACTVYAPLYRQITIGTYLRRESTRERGLEVAFSDVADAFLHYLAQHNRGRPIVLMGHSQGADMVVRLLRRFFDGDPALQERLLLAMPIGGHVFTKKGNSVGGSFQNIPVCVAPDQKGCVVAFRSHRGGEEVSPMAADIPPPGLEEVCVNPADVAHNTRHALSRTFAPMSERLRSAMPSVEGVESPFILLRNFYSAQCTYGKDGYRYLAVWPTADSNDVRSNTFKLEGWKFGTAMGLHVLDFQLPQGDLVDMVKTRAAALP